MDDGPTLPRAIVTMKKRPTATLVDDAPGESTITAFCYATSCRRHTVMSKPRRRVSNGVAITTGKCAECGRETARVGAARKSDEPDSA